MTLTEDINQIFVDEPREHLDALEKARSILRPACAKNGSHDPLLVDKDTMWDGIYAYFIATLHLEQRGLFAASEALLLEWWNDFGLRQRMEGRRLYRAAIANRLTEHFLIRAEKGMALRWALHTQADDILEGHSKGGGTGKDTLRTTFGMSEAELHHLNRIADECRHEIEESFGGDWSNAVGFAEEVIRRFTQSGATQLLAQSGSMLEFPISPAYFSALLDDIDAKEPRGKSKGDALEDVAFYLAMLLPSCIPHRGLLEGQRTFETDLVVSNYSLSTSLTSELFGRHFLIDCKNWEKSVGIRDVGYFLYRMRLTHAKFGIIFARKGLSTKDEKVGHELIRRAFHEDERVCVVIDRDDFELLRRKEQSFLWMLMEKFEQHRFGRPRFTLHE